jgi:hypothetical protein
VPAEAEVGDARFSLVGGEGRVGVFGSAVGDGVK